MTDPPLQRGRTHIRVRSFALLAAAFIQGCGGGGGGSPSNANSPPPPATSDTSAPTAPTNLVARGTSDTSVEISWDTSSDTGGSNLAGYRIFRDGSATPLTTLEAAARSYIDTGLAAGISYRYVLRAFDGAGNVSEASVEVIGTTLTGSSTPPSSQPSGLDARPVNNTCVAWNRPSMGSIQLQPFTSLTFNSSVALLQAPNDNARWYVVEQGGVVKQFSGSAPASAAVVADISDRVAGPGDTPDPGGEMGLLGMAFHPQFPTDPRVFLSYTTFASGPRQSRVSAFRSPDAGVTLDPSSETVLLTVDQPEANHNGGNIAFGKDGYLYIGLGDGGGGGDRHGDTGNAQNLNTLLGKMLRIDVNVASGYGIPTDNPFAQNAKCTASGGGNACPELYAWGFRNPWRWSFDRDTQELWVGDVGQNAWEEIDRVVRGGNYGWRCREGAHDFDAATTGCSTASLIEPIAEYDHSQGSAVTGGYVYRGTQDTAFKGRYLFGDSGSGRIWAWLADSANAPRQPTQLADTDLNIVSFGQGNDGELYVVNFDSLHHIVFQAPSGGGSAPDSLSATGCVNPQNAKQAADGLIPYDINASFWSDGAAKQRWIALPSGANITAQASGDWDFPSGTVLMKNFSMGSKLIETRLFMRHADDGSWGGYTYSWDDAQTDATLVRGGAVRDIGAGQQWIYPSEAQCVQCHTSAAGNSLGLETAQLNRDFTYPQTGRTANELATLSHIQALAPAISDPSAQSRMPDPKDTSASVESRARAYLHTNCSQCHRPSGPAPTSMDLRYTTALNQTNACDVPPQAGDLGLGSAARLIAPGDAANSIIVNRTNRRDAHAMPPIGSNVVDAEGVALLTEWIGGLAGC
jgi:uncharacterized repeat protein (TIGR03806 family)